MGVIERYVRQLSDEEISQLVSAANQENFTPQMGSPVREHAEKLMVALDQSVPVEQMTASLCSVVRKIQMAG